MTEWPVNVKNVIVVGRPLYYYTEKLFFFFNLIRYKFENNFVRPLKYNCVGQAMVTKTFCNIAHYT